jgi:teichoic acid transport system permease protein
MLTYWFVFSTGIRNSKPVITDIGEVPFIVWMLAGLMPFFYYPDDS